MTDAIRLESKKKCIPSGTSRIYPVKETLKIAEPIAQMIGVTRVADITHMDVLRIPNYSAVLPGTQDYIWVYSGKGPTKAHARASALMESIERYSSLPRQNSMYITASFAKMAREYGRENVIHPDDVLEPLKFPYHDNSVLDFLEGTDLLKNNPVFVPAGIVQARYEPSGDAVNPFQYSHTNGLASGNVIEEAICHALCEVIERDAVSIAELRASVIHFHVLRSVIDSVRRSGFNVQPLNADDYIDDPNIFHDTCMDGTDSRYIASLLGRFREENIPLLIKEITTDICIPTFMATSVQWITHNYGYLAEGHGSHPDARIALVRAITEVSQTRAANIQGARDDLRRMNYQMGNTAETKSWQFMKSNSHRNFSSVTTTQNSDILDDIQQILQNLRKVGLDRAVAINLTDPEIKVPVVRVIVPGLETFKVTKGIMGGRGRRYFPSGKGGS